MTPAGERLTGALGPQFRFRWSPIDGPELRCRHCGEWWSVGDDAGEHWVVGVWHECRVCKQERARLYQAIRRLDADYAHKGRVRARRYRKVMRRLYPNLVRAYDRELAARKRAATQAARDARRPREKAA